MTSFERVLAALAGRFADRRACTMTLPLYGARLTGVDPERYYRDPHLYLAGQLAVVERFDPDIVFGPFALSLEAEAYGVELSWTSKAPPNVRKPLPRLATLSLTHARPLGDARLAFLVEAVRLLASGLGKDRPVAGILTAPIDLPALVFGIDTWIDILLFDQSLAKTLLDISVEHFVSLARAYFAAGAAFVASPVMFANPRILNASLVESLTLPCLSKAFGQAGGPVVFHHGAIPLEEIIGLFRGLPGVAGFVVDERDSLDKIRETLGPEPLLLGGFTGPLMECRAPERIVELVRAALENRKDDPRFILASSAADIPWDTPSESIDAVFATVRSSGRGLF